MRSQGPHADEAIKQIIVRVGAGALLGTGQEVLALVLRVKGRDFHFRKVGLSSVGR